MSEFWGTAALAEGASITSANPSIGRNDVSPASAYVASVEWQRFPMHAGARSALPLIQPSAAVADDVAILVEGWIADVDGCDWPAPTPDAAHARLVALYRRDGVNFVRRLTGSFRLLVRDGQRKIVCLFADHNASRPVFWAATDNRLVWASTLESILETANGRWAISLSSVGNFLACGHHLGDRTWVEGVACVRPGECLIASASSIQRHRYFEFAPGRDAEPNADLDTLADAVGDAVLQSLEQYYRISSDPVVTLSGGADSRLVLAGLLEIGAKNIRTITWGSENQYRSGDGFIAARLARRCGVEHRFAPQTNDFLTMPAFTRRFGAETDVAAYHIGELPFVRGMLSDGRSRSLYRGDECFGWLGAVHSAEQAATAVGVRPMQALRTNLEPVFARRGYAAVCDAHNHALAAEVPQATSTDFVDLKDRHYFYLRLARYLQPVNAYKLSCVETFNPLLARPVLECLATVPSRLRLDKQVELRLLARRFPQVMTIPFATRASLADSGHTWQTTPAVRSFVHATLNRVNNLWNQLFDPMAIEAFASTCLRNRPWHGAPIRRWAARILRATGLYARARRHTWNPTTHAQPSPLRLLQRLTVMKLWIDTHEERLTLNLG